MVGSGHWLGVTDAWQADPSGRLEATGRYASTGGTLVPTVFTTTLYAPFL